MQLNPSENTRRAANNPGNTRSDVVVIGAGHNGLVCACYLAKAGLRVRVLERRGIVGGAAVTEQFHPGFRNSTASYTVGLLNPAVIRDLRLKTHGLRFVARSQANFLPLSDTESLSVFNDDAETAREFARFSTRDAQALPGFRAMIREIGDIVRRQMDRTPPNIGGGLGDLLNAGLAAMDAKGLTMPRRRDLADVFLKSVGDLLDAWFENEHVKAALAFDAVVGNFASPYAAGTAYGLLHHALGEVDGVRGAWGHAIGGMGAITQAMLAEAHALGVEVETEAEVREVIVEHGRAVGVVLADGRALQADRVAANVAPKSLYLDLVEDTHLDDEFLNRVRAIRAESATLRINVALGELPNFTCKPGIEAEDHHRSGIVIGPTMDYLEHAYLDARRGGWSHSPVVEMLIPSTMDDSLATTRSPCREPVLPALSERPGLGHPPGGRSRYGLRGDRPFRHQLLDRRHRPRGAHPCRLRVAIRTAGRRHLPRRDEPRSVVGQPPRHGPRGLPGPDRGPLPLRRRRASRRRRNRYAWRNAAREILRDVRSR